MLVRWVVWLAPIGVFALMLPLGAHGGAGLAGALGFYIAGLFARRACCSSLLLYPVVAVVARMSRCATSRARRCRRSSSRSRRARRSRRCRRWSRRGGRARPAEGRDRVRAAARRLDVQVRGAGVVDVRGALRRLVLPRRPARRASTPPSPSRDLPGVSPRRACRAARS